jgi:hypothetical protein
MENFEIFSPETISKSIPGTPVLTIARKGGLISISPSGQDLLKPNSALYFIHLDTESTTYLVADNSGFQFRNGKEGKGLQLNHTNLVIHLFKKNGISKDVNSYRFRINNSVEIKVGEKVVMAHPLIKLPAQK